MCFFYHYKLLIKIFFFLGDIFEDWDLAERQIEKHATETGFEVLKRRLGKNKHGEIISRTFECKNSREYHARKKADIEDNRERESVKINCPWKVNLYLSNGVIRITSLCKEHNHPLIENLKDVASKFHRLSPRMLEEVEFLVNIGCGAGPIIRGLQKRFSDALIYPKNVYNAICLFRSSKKIVKTDAAETYDKLIQMQCKEHS
jgi:FAR1 DNA-binding domain